MNKRTKVGLAFAAGIAGGILFYRWSEAGIPKNTDCSYLAAPATDAAALGLGSYAAYRGFQKKDWFLALLGAAVASTHVMQYVYQKGKNELRRTP